MRYTPGEQWIRLLYGYSPVMENTAMTAEHIGGLERRTGIQPLRFTHPGFARLSSAIRPKEGPPKSVILTGTAGDGKTTLCSDLYEELTGHEPDRSHERDTIEYDSRSGKKRLTFIWDMTAWRQVTEERLLQEQVDTLATFARSVFGQGDDLFVIAVNDGQLYEIFSYLPEDAPPELAQLRQEVFLMHANATEDNKEHRLRLINLSKISSKLLMEQCLEAILDREEWDCLNTEADNPLFSSTSSIRQNYSLLRTPTVRARLVTLAELADASGFHMPIRGILCLLTNAILGNPAARDNVLRPQKNIEAIMAKSPQKAALHRTLFGDNLGQVKRNRREVYRFLSMLQIGVETTNDLDELLVFGAEDEELQALYDEVVCNDPYKQRNPEFLPLCKEYIRGDLGADDMSRFLVELSSERRRLFLTASDENMKELKLWRSSVFHHAGDYIDKLLTPLKKGESIRLSVVRRLVAGLNRTWTGLFITDQPDDLYLSTGLDVTTAAISDILHGQVEIGGSGSSSVGISGDPDSDCPYMVIRFADRMFKFDVTLARFEFLCRVAKGAMPNSFSRESAEDFAMLKQRCMAELRPSANDTVINGMRITRSGKIERIPIHLSES